MTSRDIHLVVVPKRVAGALSAVLLFLLAAHIVGLLLIHGLGYSHVFGLIPLFNIAGEGNIPTFFASSLLLLNGILFLILWRVSSPGQKGKKIWLLLSTVFCILAIDEFAMIHELLIYPVREALDLGGLLFFAWVVPYLLIVIILGVVTTPFLWSLGCRFRLLFASSAAVYLGGAIGIEMLGGRYFESQNEHVDFVYRLLQTTEELMEFTGLIILTYTLLELMQSHYPGTKISIECQPCPAKTEAE